MGTSGMTSVPIAARRRPGGPLAPVAARGRRVWQSARTQVWYKTLDAVVTAPARPRGTLRAALRLLLDPQQANYDRVGALVHAADHLLPGIAQRLSRTLLQPDALPLATDSAALLAYGSGGTLFLLAQGEARWVLKIYRRSLGLPGPQLQALGREFKQKVAAVSAWYDEKHRPLVAPVSFVLVHGPLRRVPALASLQPYLSPPHRDLVADFTDDELVHLGQQEPDFRRQLRHFVYTTLRVYEEQGRCLDFVGAGNVVVVQAGGEHRIVVLDYGIFDRETLVRRAPKTLALVEDRMRRLRGLQAALAADGLGGGRSADG
jgi:hypothetical protein